MNLLNETIEVLANNGKTPDNVLWVGNKEAKTTWSQFTKIADFEYDDGYGSNCIPSSLLIVGSDFWLERYEYDGSEWWEFKRFPTEPAKTATMSFVGKGWDRSIAWVES